MARQPFFTSQTPIAQMDTRLAGSIGDRLGAGIQQGVQAFMAGVEEKRMKEEKKQMEDSALQFWSKNKDEFGLGHLSDDDFKAGMKGMGGPEKFMSVAMEMKGMKDEAEHRKFLQEQYSAQSEAMRFETARKMKSDAAIAKSFDPKAKARDQIMGGAQFGQIDFSPPTPEESMMMALRGGADPKDLAQTAELFASNTVSPRLEMAGGKVPVIIGGKQWEIDPAYKAMQNAERGYKPHEVKELIGLLKEAEANGDQRSAEFYAKAIEKATTKSGNSLWDMTEDEDTPSTEAPETAKPKSKLPRVITRDEYDALAPGSQFVGSDGKTYQKPKEQERRKPKSLSDLVTQG